MKKLYKSILALVLLSVCSEARNLKIFVDEQGVDINFPKDITDDLIFEIGYYSNRDSEVEDFDRTNREGKKGTKTDETNLFLSLKYNVIKIANSNIFWGVEYEKFQRDAEQIGYYKSGSTQLPFDSFVKLNGDKFNLLSEIVYGDNHDSWRGYLRVTVTPKTELDVDQGTKIYPNLITGGDYTGEATFDLSYKIEGELKWNTGEYMDIGIGGSYAFIPYEYQYKGLNENRDAYVEKSQIYDEKTKEYFLKVHFKKLFDGISPTIGYKQIVVDDNKIEDSDSHAADRNFVFVGIEKWF